MPSVSTPRSSPLPAGITAALIAIAIAGASGWGTQLYGRRLASRHLEVASTQDVPFRYQTMTLQRAALASGHVLPIYGSSELFCCGSPHRPTELFAREPTGFAAFAVGRGGTADLFFMQALAALGHDLSGRKVVISDSPPWFYRRQGLGRAEYAGNFVSETAYAFVFDAPISPHVRTVGARRMLAYADIQRDDPLLRIALADVARPTMPHAAEYAALVPLGRLASWVLRARDAARTVVFVWSQRWRRPDSGAHPTALDWPSLAARGTSIAEWLDTTNPFGFPDRAYGEMRRRDRFRKALALWESGQTNRDGQLYPPPIEWEAAVSHSAEWTDLRLVLRVLHELGARPLVWTLPMPGTFDDYTPKSAAARQRYYDRYREVVEEARVPWLDFRAHDEDPFFLTDVGSHLSARGWVFADRALDMFWHGHSIDDIREALATLAAEVPPPSAPAPAGAAMANG